MALESLRVCGFRNLQDTEVKLEGKEIFLIGENGQGKSNFLEAVYFSAYAASFRTENDNELICDGKQECSVISKISDSLYEKIQIKIEKGKKSVFCDEKRVHDRKILLEGIPVVVFCHEDMEFVSGIPEKKRWFFDQTISLYNKEYLDSLRRYKKIVKTRNAILKSGQRDLLPLLDIQLIESGLVLMAERKAASEAFSIHFSQLYETVSGIDNVCIQYSPSWKCLDSDTLVQQLEQKRDMELALGTSSSGPHRDRYIFSRRGANFAIKASTGQRRLLSLLLRTAQAERYTAESKNLPILLLDDVMLELDAEKRKRFLRVLPHYEQALFTFLPTEPYSEYMSTHTRVYTVSGGKIQE
jgi:DNA replication and repair protein RecF